MGAKLIHIDVGVTMGQASVFGCKPTIEILCEGTDGGRIWDDYIQLQLTGKPPAACNCPDCIGIAKIMYESDCGFVKARALYCRQMRLRRRLDSRVRGGDTDGEG